MRKLLLLIFAFFFAFAGFTQSSYSEVKLEVKEDYQLAESVVLKASNYLLTTKYDKEDLERLYAIEFIMKWILSLFYRKPTCLVYTWERWQNMLLSIKMREQTPTL
jgi:hypothetical protein